MFSSRRLAVLSTLLLSGSANAQCLEPNLELFGAPDLDGAPGTINALLSYQGSLYVGGSFSRAGGIEAENVAKWNGVIWSPVGSGVPGIVRDLILAPTPEGPAALHAAGRCFVGDLSASPISRWDGVAWTADARLQGDALDAHVYPSNNGRLYLGGTFALETDQPTRTRSTFVTIGATVDSIGVLGSVRRLATAHFSNGEHLVAAGSFLSVEGINASDIAKFNGTIWTAFPPVPGIERLGQVESLGTLPMLGASAPVDQLWASGYSTGTFVWTPGVGNGSWQQAPGTAAFSLAPSVLFADTRVAVMPRMLAAGPNFNFGGTRELGVLSGATWSPVSPLASDAGNQSVFALATFSPTPSANPPLIIAGSYDGLWPAPGAGSFEPAQRLNSIASFDGVSLAPLGGESVGVTTPGARGVAFNATTGQLLVVGEFTQRDSQPQSNAIARWSDGEWSTPDSGVVGTASRVVRFASGFAVLGSMALRDDPAATYIAMVSQSGELSGSGLTGSASGSLASGVIGGTERLFTTSQGTVRQFSNGAWSNLPTLFGTIRGISVAPDVIAGSGNTLYAFGLNITSGNRPIARLVNNAWQSVGDSTIGSTASVSSVLVVPTPSGQRLHAFGQFIATNRLASVAILQPNGSWSLSGLDQAPFVRGASVVQLDGEQVVIGFGEFSSYDATNAIRYSYLARLGANGWEPWGPYINGPIRAMDVIQPEGSQGPRILIAGDFTRVGETRVRGFATLVPCRACLADLDASGGVDAVDLGIFMDHYERGEDGADIDLSGGIDATDLAAFFTAFEAGC